MKKVAILMGGPSLEHEVSLASGKQILNYLDIKKYKPIPVVIDKDGKWPLPQKELKKFDIILTAAMHGEYGEDGGLQKELEELKVPFTGCGSKASKLGMDKGDSLNLFKEKKLLVPEFFEAKKGKIENPFGFPVVIKPRDRGSSIGIYIANNEDELISSVDEAFKFSKNILLQRFIKGRELTCGVLERRGKPRALIPTEIVPKEKTFFDYDAKYVPGASEEITPPDLPKKIIKQVQKQSLVAHKAIGARGYSRTDFILGEDEKLYVLEINTLPGMGKTGLIPQGAQAMGIDFEKLLDIILIESLRIKG